MKKSPIPVNRDLGKHFDFNVNSEHFVRVFFQGAGLKASLSTARHINENKSFNFWLFFLPDLLKNTFS